MYTVIYTINLKNNISVSLTVPEPVYMTIFNPMLFYGGRTLL